MQADRHTTEAQRPKRSRRRLWWWLGGILGFLVAVFFIGGGWYFSSQIRSDALAVNDPDPPDYEFEVTAVGDDSITIALPSKDDDDLVSSQTLGVGWPGGYGQVSAVLGQTATEITREFVLFDGETLRPGDRILLEGYAYPPDPGVLGIDFETIHYESAFGEFEAWFVEGTGTTWAIHIHGRGAHQREGLRALPAFVEQGIPSLLIAYRNDTGYPATEDRLARFGATEWEDVEGAVEYALASGADDVILVGYSMGGAMAVSFLYQSELAPSVRAVVLDSPALSLGAMVDARAADTGLPLVGLRVPRPLTAAAKTIAAIRFDVDWSDLDYVERADELRAPILLFHGSEDDSVPIWLSDTLAAERPDIVTYVRVEGAGHVRSWNVDREQYMQALKDFLVGVVETG